MQLSGSHKCPLGGHNSSNYELVTELGSCTFYRLTFVLVRIIEPSVLLCSGAVGQDDFNRNDTFFTSANTLENELCTSSVTSPLYYLSPGCNLESVVIMS